MPIKKGTPPHPGKVLKKNFLDDENISIKSFANKIGESGKTVSDIVNERGYITPEIARKLSNAFNTAPDFWINLQTNYDLWRAREGDRGTDNPFYDLMRVCGDAVLKLIGVESPTDYITKAVVLKEKSLYPDTMAFPISLNRKDLEIVVIEFQGYSHEWLRYSLAAKTAMYCAHAKYNGPILGVIIYTDQKHKDAALPMSVESLSGSYWLKGHFKEIVLTDYSDRDIMEIDPRLVALAPFTIPKDFPREKLKERCREWNKVVQQLFTDDVYHDIVQILMLFLLDRFKDLSIEEVKAMWNFDLSKTKAGQELYLMGDKNGEKRGEKRTILEEIDRIQDLYSQGELTDSIYKKLIGPLEEKLALLETVAMQDIKHEETGAAAVSI